MLRSMIANTMVTQAVAWMAPFTAERIEVNDELNDATAGWGNDPMQDGYDQHHSYEDSDNEF